MQPSPPVVTGESTHEWLFKRNCALTPGQFGGALIAVGAWSLVVALVLTWRGAWLVLPFSIIELLALAAAFVAYARHAGDYERLVAGPSRLFVETCIGMRVSRERAESPWLRVQHTGRPGDLLAVHNGSQTITLGRFVPRDGRAALARDLKRVLGGSPAA